jgi:transposase
MTADRPPGLAQGQRWRCDSCGNLTRFDVESTERVRRFWHLDLSGEGQVEEETFLEVSDPQVTCRWCGSRDTITVINAPGVTGPAAAS